MELKIYYDKISGEYIYGYCAYCHRIIKEDEKYIEVDGKLYHYSKKDTFDNCYFEEEIVNDK